MDELELEVSNLGLQLKEHGGGIYNFFKNVSVSRWKRYKAIYSWNILQLCWKCLIHYEQSINN